MHELSIAQSLVEQVVAVAARERASAVLEITVVVGSLSGIEPEALELAFPLAAESTPAQGARLVIERKTATLTCRSCGRVTEPDLALLVCGACGSLDVALSGGRDLQLRSVTLETPAEEAANA